MDFQIVAFEVSFALLRIENISCNFWVFCLENPCFDDLATMNNRSLENLIEAILRIISKPI